MRMTTNDHLAGAATVAWPRGRIRREDVQRAESVHSYCLGLRATEFPTIANPGPAQTAGTGGRADSFLSPRAALTGTLDNTGTSGSLPSNAGGSSSVPATRAFKLACRQRRRLESLPGSTGVSSSGPGNAGGSSRTGGSSFGVWQYRRLKLGARNTGGSSSDGRPSSVSGSTGGSSSVPGKRWPGRPDGKDDIRNGWLHQQGRPTGAGRGTGGSAAAQRPAALVASAGGNGAALGAVEERPPPAWSCRRFAILREVPISSAPVVHSRGQLPLRAADRSTPSTSSTTSAGPKGTQVPAHGGSCSTAAPGSTRIPTTTVLGRTTWSTFFDRFLGHGFMVGNVEYRSTTGTSRRRLRPLLSGRAPGRQVVLGTTWTISTATKRAMW